MHENYVKFSRGLRVSGSQIFRSNQTHLGISKNIVGLGDCVNSR